MRIASPLAALLAGTLLLPGCAVQAPPAAVAAPHGPGADCAQGFDEAAISEIDKRHRKLLTALNAGQVEQALAFYSNDAVVVARVAREQGFRGLAWVRLYLQEHLVARGARFDTDDMFQGVAQHCDVQVHGGQYRLSLDGEKQPRPYLIVWRRMNADWFVIAHHVDLAPRAAPQPAGASAR